jgi:vitamin B12 transporter
MRALYLTASALALAAGAPAFAEDSKPVSQLIVTATRLPTDITDAPDAIVIDRPRIDLHQAVFAADILSLVPGLSVSRNGAFGGITGVRMRGASVDKTLVLIDGVIQNDASQPTGGYDFADLDLSDIQRVEVLSGPQGSLWGSDAIGGVIAFTTREENGWRANIEGGTFSTVRGSGGAGQSSDAWAANLSVSGFNSAGISKADGFPEKDGFWSWTAAGGGRIRLSPAITVDGRLRYNSSRTDIDGYAPPFFSFGDTPEFATSQSWTGFVRATVDGPWDFRHTLSLNGYDLNRASLGSSFPSSFHAARQDWRWMAERGAPLDRWGLAVGAEYDRTTANLSTGDTAHLGDTSVFAVARVRPIDRLRLTASLRYDDPSAYAGRVTGRASASLDIGWGLALTADWGQGFKSPTISEIACDFCFPAGPSVGLKPELAEGWDLGLRWSGLGGRAHAHVDGYRLAVRNQISYGIGRYVNIDRTLASGVDVDGDVRLTDQLTLRGEYAWTDAIDRSTGLRLIRVPQHSGSVSIEWGGGKLSGAFTVRAEGPQADSDPSTFAYATRPGFLVADLAAGYKITPKIEFTVRLENIGDRHFQEALGYGEPGRAAYLGLRLRN